MAKGFASVKLVLLQQVIEGGTEAHTLLQIGLGMVAVCGHIFPVFANFKGGKGVAALAGIGLALHPPAALGAMGVYVTVLGLGRISSLASLSAVLSYPLWMILVFRTEYLSLVVFSLLLPLLVIATHRNNIRRLISGKEA
jgi:glycerol-3-phosphate acyltransferase PlsY